uniref:Uncharacterized protein n=1 Tax=Sulfolobus neozealandicus TaxID=299422 RepID=Q5DVE0_9CREN|nr:hypothetical protein [Sulfolobus neozealandicus]
MNAKLREVLDLIKSNEPGEVAKKLMNMLNNDPKITKVFADNSAFSLDKPQFVIAQEFKEYDKNEQGKYEETHRGIVVKLIYNSYILELIFYEMENDMASVDYHILRQ